MIALKIKLRMKACAKLQGNSMNSFKKDSREFIFLNVIQVVFDTLKIDFCYYRNNNE